MICGVSSLCLGSESGQTATKPFCRLTPCMSHSVSVGQQALSAEDLSLSLWVRTRGDVGLGYTIILVYFLLCNTVFPEGRVGDGVALRPQKKWWPLSKSLCQILHCFLDSRLPEVCPPHLSILVGCGSESRRPQSSLPPASSSDGWRMDCRLYRIVGALELQVLGGRQGQPLAQSH